MLAELDKMQETEFGLVLAAQAVPLPRLKACRLSVLLVGDVSLATLEQDRQLSRSYCTAWDPLLTTSAALASSGGLAARVAKLTAKLTESGGQVVVGVCLGGSEARCDPLQTARNLLAVQREITRLVNIEPLGYHTTHYFRVFPVSCSPPCLCCTRRPGAPRTPPAGRANSPLTWPA